MRILEKLTGMAIQKRFLISLLMLFEVCAGFSQQLFFNRVLPSDGISFRHVTAIAQDQKGYLWFTTRRGLYRYDGYEMISYKNNPLDPNSLASNLLETICIDSAGNIWIGTQGAGLDRFDPETGIFQHFRHDPNNPASIGLDFQSALLADHNGDIWIGGVGLDHFDASSGTFTHYINDPADPSSLSCDAVVTIYKDKQGTIWIGTGSVYGVAEGNTEGGLNRFDRETGKFTRYMHDPSDPYSLINNKVSAIFEDSKGTFWVGTAGDGLHTMDRDNGTFERLTYDPLHPEKLSRPPLSKEYGTVDHITFIHDDLNGSLWIGTSESGINYYDPMAGKITHIGSDTNIAGNYTDRTAWSFCTSRDGEIWIGTLSGNLYCVDPFRKEIPHYNLSFGAANCFLEQSNGELLIGTENGLLRTGFDNGITLFNPPDVSPEGLYDNYIQTIKKDSRSNFWVSAGSGLFIWDTNSGKLSRYRNDPEFSRLLNNNFTITIYEDRDKNLWFGTFRGLVFLDPETRSMGHYFLQPVDSAFGQNVITSILEDKAGKFWIGGSSGIGINLFNRENHEFIRYLDGSGINCIYEDNSGKMWIGSSDGLFSYDPGRDAFIRFTDYYSLYDFTEVVSIVEDNSNLLWLGTTSGIVSLDADRRKINLFGNYFGVKENALKSGSNFESRDGELFFGDETGYFSFYPEELNRNLKAPEILLTSFRLGDQPLKPGEGGPLNEDISKANRISLSYNQNVFSFDFAAIDYAYPQENRQLFMLENYDISWRKANEERRAYYFNVPPGEYVFHVKAANVYGIWAEKKIDIVILPPWWRKWWAYMIYGLLFIGLVLAVDRFQRRRLLRAEKERARQKELAQAKEIEMAYRELKATQTQLIQSEKMASLGELTAGIAHEIQNPLNFVNNFSEVSAELVHEMKQELAVGSWQLAGEIADDIKQNLDKILLHGKRADAIVKGMLQHSRTSSGVKEPTDINALCNEYLRLAYHGLRAKDKSFNADIKTDFDHTLPKINVIPQDFGRVLLNLINNAFYAVSNRNLSGFSNLTGLEYKPTVTVSTKRSLSLQGEGRGEVLIIVKDNGPGIPDEIMDKIFQPFFTTKPTGQGTGLGLSLSYDIITKGHGGELKVNTKVGEETEFIISIPI